MAVLAEAISVVIRVSDIEDRVLGGISSFRLEVPNETFCSDGSLVRIGFLNPRDVGAFVSNLATVGLRLTDSPTSDVAVVDQNTGPTYPWQWIQVCEYEVAGCPIMVKGVALADSEPGELALPINWDPVEYANLAKSFVPTGQVGQRVLELTNGRFSDPDAWAREILKTYANQVAESSSLMNGGRELPFPSVFMRFDSSEFKSILQLSQLCTIPFEVFCGDEDDEGVLVAFRGSEGSG